MEQQSIVNILVIWRGKKLNVEMNTNSKVKELGQRLHILTNVKSDTLRLLVPQSAKKGSRLIAPFSDENSSLSLQQADILELHGRPIRMMGVFDEEIEEVSRTSVKSDLRIAGFEEEEERLRQRMLSRPQASLKLPQGKYIFCDFRPLPGNELNPPPSEALRRMHMLACDPGIIAIMNKHRWRVGIMTEMQPEGYVGISERCLLGFNKNHGEEISLRLRTDDLKGFRNYESIKKTLLHELAHMVYGEHDASFYALDKQLNQEAASLDWTKSRSYTLSSYKISHPYEEHLDLAATNTYIGQKLGGASNSLATARASSVAAAFNRFLNASTEKPQTSNRGHTSDSEMELDPDYAEVKGDQKMIQAEPDHENTQMLNNLMHVDAIENIGNHLSTHSSFPNRDDEPDPDDYLDNETMPEPDPDDSHAGQILVCIDKPNHDGSQVSRAPKLHVEPDPDDSRLNIVDADHQNMLEPDPDDSVSATNPLRNSEEPDPDDCISNIVDFHPRSMVNSDPHDSGAGTAVSKTHEEPDPDDCATVNESRKTMEPDTENSRTAVNVQSELDPDDHMDGFNAEVIQRIEEPVAAICSRIQTAIEMLRSQATPAEATSALQTLVKIIRNVIEHPHEMKFRRLRKANPQLQKNVVNYKAAMEVLTMVGFYEDVMLDEVGRAEAYLVLKRNDPGLLWLAKSSLEVSLP